MPEGPLSDSLRIVQHSSGYTAIHGEGLSAVLNSFNVTMDASPEALTYTGRHAPHITLITRQEAAQLSTSSHINASRFQRELVLQDLHFVGIGSGGSSGDRHLVVVCPEVNKTRRRLGLPPKDLHISLQGSGAGSWSRGLDSLEQAWDPSSPPADLEPATLRAIAKDLLLSQNGEEAFSLAIVLCGHTGVSTDLLLLANASFSTGRYRTAMLAFAAAYAKLQDSDQDKLKSACVRGILECYAYTELGALYLSTEEGEIQSLSAPLSMLLLQPWQDDLRDAILARSCEQASTAGWTSHQRWECSRGKRLLFPKKPQDSGPHLKMQRFFSWVVPFRLAASSTPRSSQDVVACHHPAIGVSHTVTLTEEEPLPSSWFEGSGVKHTFIPVQNGRAPSMQDLHLFIKLVADEISRGGAVLVHCGGGKGRAGTFIAAWMSAFGLGASSPEWHYPALGPSQSIQLLRTLRPGSIETDEQESSLRKWNDFVARNGPLPRLPDEPEPSEPEVKTRCERTNHELEKVDLIILVGLPGSGKSHFRNLLRQRHPSRWTHVSSDEDGGRSAVESAASNHRVGAGRKGLIIDRTNVDTASRTQLLRLAQAAQRSMAVFFDFPAPFCSARASMRPNHPTLRAAAAAKVIEGFAARLEAPSLSEGFSLVVTVRSTAAVDRLIEQVAPIELFKFPRTPHVFRPRVLDAESATADDLVIDYGDFASEPTASAGMGHWHRIVLTEKIDGANMGISLGGDRQIVCQNRSHWVSSADHAQFRKLDSWVEANRADLYTVLDRDNDGFIQRWILFGEWMAAVHSVEYTRLPSLFIAYDVYDRQTQRFLPHSGVVRLLAPTRIPVVPLLSVSNSLPDPVDLVRLANLPSPFTEPDARREGIYIKIEDDNQVRGRGKVVRKDFIQGNEHWTKNMIRYNTVREDLEYNYDLMSSV